MPLAAFKPTALACGASDADPTSTAAAAASACLQIPTKDLSEGHYGQINALQLEVLLQQQVHAYTAPTHLSGFECQTDAV